MFPYRSMTSFYVLGHTQTHVHYTYKDVTRVFELVGVVYVASSLPVCLASAGPVFCRQEAIKTRSIFMSLDSETCRIRCCRYQNPQIKGTPQSIAVVDLGLTWAAFFWICLMSTAQSFQ